jgi:AraC-like DNA-binding protein
MRFLEFKPHTNLAQFIEVYWELKCAENFTVHDKVIPDGCIDLIINLGDDHIVESESCVLKSEKIYLGGAITEMKENTIKPNAHLIGVRFRPAAFSHFYSFSSLHEATDHCVEIDNNMMPDLKSLTGDFCNVFDYFYSGRLVQPKHFLLPVIDTVTTLKGNIAVDQLAKLNCTTVRQLERTFKCHIGLSPKQYINIIRFKFAQQLIASSYPERNLVDIAFECGYYDHAHLSNEIKRYTGVAPSKLR